MNGAVGSLQEQCTFDRRKITDIEDNFGRGTNPRARRGLNRIPFI